LLLFLLLAIMISYIFSRQRERAREAHRREQEARTLYESGLRDRAEEVNHREQEMRTFYKLLQATNDEKDLKYQLNLIAQAIVDAFSFCGVSTCAILLPDSNKKMSLQRDPCTYGKSFYHHHPNSNLQINYRRSLPFRTQELVY